MDEERVKRAVDEWLDALDIGLATPDRAATAKRVAELWSDLLSGVGEDASAYLRGGFAAGYHELVALRGIPFFSMCEHHLLPFFGTVHVAYIPGAAGNVAGASNLAKVVASVSRRLQIQERLTSEIAEAIATGVDASAVLVVAQGEHLCMTMKDHTDVGSQLLTTVALGRFQEDQALRAQAVSLLLELAKTGMGGAR